jgi:hypothetical protein
MRRRTGDVRHAMFGEPRKMVGNWLAGVSEDPRGAAENRLQEDLQPAIAANVIERAPYGRAVRRARDCHGRGKAGKIVQDHLRYANRIGGQQHPLGARVVRHLFSGLKAFPAAHQLNEQGGRMEMVMLLDAQTRYQLRRRKNQFALVRQLSGHTQPTP